jgi:hypothetical protein
MTKLLINENPLIILPSLAVKIGLNEAIILQQIHYWLDPRTNKNLKNGVYWVYNTYSQWHLQFPFFSEITIRRAISSLEKQDLLISKTFNANSFNNIKWYTINYEKLKEFEDDSSEKKSIGSNRSDRHDQNDQIDRSNRSDYQIKMIRSNIETKTSTENTTENSLYTQTNLNKIDFNNELERENHMLQSWDKIVKKNTSITKLTPNRKKILKERLNEFFNNDLNLWNNYCKKIATSKFLMGGVNDFKASLDWSLREEVIIRILEGEYGVNDYKNNEDNSVIEVENSLEKIKLIIDSLNEDQISKLIRKDLLEYFGVSIYNSWFSKIENIKLSEEKFIIKVKSNFIADYLQTHYLNKIKEICLSKIKYAKGVDIIF